MLLLPGSLWYGVVVPVRVPSMGQIDLLKYYSYLIEPLTNNGRNGTSIFLTQWQSWYFWFLKFQEPNYINQSLIQILLI